MCGVGRLGQKHSLGRVCHGLWTVLDDRDRSMILERSVTAYGRCREIGAEARFFERSLTAYLRCRETGTAESSWNGLSPSRDGAGRLGRKNGLVTVYHGLWAV